MVEPSSLSPGQLAELTFDELEEVLDSEGVYDARTLSIAFLELDIRRERAAQAWDDYVDSLTSDN